MAKLIRFATGVVGGALRWQVVGYYNELFDLVVGREDRFQVFLLPPPVGPFDTEDYANDGTGLICGSEVEVRYTDPLRIGLLAMSFFPIQNERIAMAIHDYFCMISQWLSMRSTRRFYRKIGGWVVEFVLVQGIPIHQ